MVRRIALMAVLAMLVAAPAWAGGPVEKLLFWQQSRQPQQLGTHVQAARTVVRDYLAATLARPGQTATTRLYDCRPGWCHFDVQGTSNCVGVVQVRESPGEWFVWFSRLRCR